MEKTLTENTELIQRIEAALDNIRPYLEADGGDIKVVKIDEENALHVELLGACGDCSMSMMTLKSGVEQTVLNAVPEITKVISINT